MRDLHVCLLFPIDAAFEKAYQKTNPYLFKLFTSSGDYLQFFTINCKKYLGKVCSLVQTYEELEGLEKHLLSLLKQLAPSYSFSSNSLLLYAAHRPGN